MKKFLVACAAVSIYSSVGSAQGFYKPVSADSAAKRDVAKLLQLIDLPAVRRDSALMIVKVAELTKRGLSGVSGSQDPAYLALMKQRNSALMALMKSPADSMQLATNISSSTPRH